LYKIYKLKNLIINTDNFDNSNEILDKNEITSNDSSFLDIDNNISIDDIEFIKNSNNNQNDNKIFKINELIENFEKLTNKINILDEKLTK
jgi:hypothetical protein